MLARRKIDIAAVLFIFLLALGVRLLYQHESIVDDPVRADAVRYINAALNLSYFGVYSIDKPSDDGRPPETRSNWPPGYPLFLTLFVDRELDSILRVQAVMGAFAAVFTFLIARMALGLPWAFFSGMLTAFSPHLIAMDGYLLTESLFVFVMMLGSLALSISWRENRYILTLFAGILLAVSAYIRMVNMLFLFFILPLLFLRPGRTGISPRSVWSKHLALFLLGFIIIAGAHHEFLSRTAPPGSSVNEPADYVSLPDRLEIFWYFLAPPVFYAKGDSHINAINQDSQWRDLPKGSLGDIFREFPIQVITWNLWGRPYYLWHWDNAYNGDVYVYPMLRKGFEENFFLKTIHRIMRFIHWPLYALSLTALIVMAVRWRRRSLQISQRALIVPALCFLYFLVMLSLTTWLPRHSIPARPYSYIMAAALLSWIYMYLKGLKGRDQNCDNLLS